MAALFILTWIPTHATIFFVFVLANAVTQSIVCSYFSSSVVATSSYFGPFAMQALMTGQAAVAVIISLIQVTVTALSLDGNPVKRREEKERAAEDNAASLFFSLTTAGLLVAFLAHAHLVRMPVYRNVAAPFEMGKVIETEEEEGLMTSTVGSLREIEPVLPVDPRKVGNTFPWRYELTPRHIGRKDQPDVQPLCNVRVRCYAGKFVHYISVSVLTQTRGIIPSDHCSRAICQPTHVFASVQPTTLQRCPFSDIQCWRLDRPCYMLLFSVPSVVTKAHRPALAQPGDICSIVLGMQRRRWYKA